MESENLIEENEESSSTTTNKSKRTDPVWQYFEVNTTKKQWICKLCKNPRTFIYTTECASSTAAKKHLKNAPHTKEFNLINDLEKPATGKTLPKQNKKDDPKQTKMTAFSTQNQKKYSDDHWKQKKYNETLVMLVCNPVFTINQLKSEEFRANIAVADSQLKVPADYKAWKALINDNFAKKRSLVIKKMKLLEVKYNAILDIWSDANVHTSYLGVSIQFLNVQASALERIFLEMRPLNNKHTGTYIRDVFTSILSDFELSEDNLFKVITDNASNMINAFVEINEDEDSLSESDTDISDNSQSQYRLEEDHLEDFSDFEERNENKRFGCVAHSLNLALTFVLKRHILTMDGFTALKKLITHFNKSHEGKKNLIEATGGPSLLKLCGTRWTQWIIALERFLKIKDHVKKIIRAKQLAFPTNIEIEQFKSIVLFLKPINELLVLIQAENSVTISMVYPKLKIFIQDVQNKEYNGNEFMKQFRDDFINQLRTRFAFILDVNDSKFEKCFIMSTFLDPNFSWLMDELDELCAKGLVKKSVKIKNNPQVQTQNPTNLNQNALADEGENSSAFERLKAEKRRNIARSTISHEPMTEIGKAIDAYVAWAKEELPDDINPIKFWSNPDPKWRILSEFALQVLSIPATSAAQERIFSYAGIATDKRRSRIGSEHLNKKLFIHLNKKFFI